MKLEGVTVLDLTQFLPGPFLTQMMADHGAEVLKIEHPAHPEPTRAIGPTRDGTSVYFAVTQRGKKSVTLDLKREEGREIFMRLAAQSDVVVESFRPGVAHRLGVDVEAVRAVRPDVVYASISAFGQEGPLRDRPAHDLAVSALAGVLANGRDEEGRPVIPGLAAADMLSATLALGAIAMALFRRERTGEGDYVDLAMMDGLLAASANNVGPVFAEGRAPRVGRERLLGGSAMYQIYETADGAYVVLGGTEPKFAQNLFRALDREDLAEVCEREPGPAQREAMELLRELFKTRTQAQWVEWFQSLDVCFAPVNDLRQAFDHPQARARKMLLVDAEGHEHIGVPINFSGEPAQPRLSAPGHGEHTDEVLVRLGYAPARIAHLRAEGVI
ncbi:MAG: CaiB/BaiF CoA-transferase family protein [Gammaproteobacteria bacterium]